MTSDSFSFRFLSRDAGRLASFSFFILILIVLPDCSATNGGSGRSLGELLNLASQANSKHDIDAEESYLRQAIGQTGTDRERSQARRALARTRWKFHRDFDEASRFLDEAAQIPAERSKAWIERTEMELSRPDFQSARRAALKAVELANTHFESRAAAVAFGKAVVAENAQRRWEHQAVEHDVLVEAQERLRDLVATAPGDVEVSELAFTTSILLDRGPDAWKAWKSYYHVTALDTTPGLLAESAAELESALAQWKGSESSPAARRRLIAALAGTRFFLEAALIAMAPRGREAASLEIEPPIREIVAYAAFCRTVESVSDEFYRQTAIGEGDRNAYSNEIEKAVATLWPRLDSPGSPPPVSSGLRRSLAAVERELGDRFGAHFRTGRTAGYDGIHFGHEIERDTETVHQYGYSASLTYTVLDRMVSNGFQSWAWNSTAETGGWATRTSMVAIREPLLAELNFIWNTFASEQERSALQEKAQKDAALDDERARKDPAGFLPGLKFRLAFRIVDELLDDLRERGTGENDMRMAFINEMKKLGTEAVIFAHEGRHAIDMSLDSSLKSPDLEFTAKLSQIAFSSRPRWMMVSLIQENIGDPTPHGKANQRVMQGMVDWMEQNSDQIDGLDLSRPYLPQLDLLNRNQLVAAVRSMDPLAQKR